MANEIRYGGTLDETGKTVIAQVFTTAGVQIGADVATAELGPAGAYYGDMPAAPAAEYDFRFLEEISTGPSVYQHIQWISGYWDGVTISSNTKRPVIE